MGRLVQLEVENFKSYRGKQIIGPFKHFTSVIGPNGSGKSNLMDAISFVLGVKSSQLRSAQLKELIYRAGRKPAANDSDGNENSESDEADEGENYVQAKRAYVCAIYERGEDDIVRFMRTISISGSSEYKINGKTVTFAVYSSTLEKENILIKARNFLVFQGDVEAVASQGSKELTKLIEQISGSIDLKPEYERLKALLETTTENSTHALTKKRGMNAELKQFREQKEEAERFVKQQKQLAKQITTHLLWKLYHLDQKIDALEKEVEQEKESTEERETQLTALDTKLREAKKAQAQCSRQLLKLENKSQDLAKQIEAKKPTLVGQEEQIKHGQKRLSVAEENLAKMNKEVERQQSEIRKMQKDYDKLDRASARYEETVERRRAEEGRDLSADELSNYNAKKDELRRRIFAETQELNTLQRHLKSAQEKKAQLDENSRTSESRKLLLDDERTMLTGRRDMLRTRVEELSREMRKAHKDVEAVEAEKRKLIQEETEINERLMETQHKLQQARVDRQESERDARQKEMLSELKRVFEGVYGRVLDLCKPTQRKYELAISIILGRNMDAIVVDSQKTAIACIQFLREQRSGMATFLPLDTISAKPLNERLRNVRHAHLAVDIIQFDKAYEVAMQYACGNSLVCDTIEVAKDICYKQQLNVKAVSLDGTVIHKTGMITGGQSHGDSKNARRWEEREVDNLKKAHSTLIVQQQEMAKQRRKVQGDEQLRALLTDTESRLRVANEDLTSTQRKLDATLAEIRAMESESEKLEPSLASVTKELNDLTAKVEVVDTRIKNVENEVFADFCSRIGVANIREYEEQNLKETQLVEEKRMQFATQKAKLENLLEFERDKAAQITTRIASLERTIQEDTTKLEKLQADHAAMQVSQEKLQAKLEDYQTQIEVAKLEVDERATEVAGVKKEIAKVNKEFEGVTKIIMNKESQIEELSAEKFSVFRRCKLEEIDIPLLEGSLESLSLDQLDAAQRPNPDSMDVDGEEMMGTQDSRAQIQGIEVDFSGLKRAYQDDGSEEMEIEFQESISNLRAELARMAPNMRAVDRLDEVEAKLKETAREFDDARKDAKSAKDAFTDVKQQRYDLFYTAYEHIAEKIDHVYKELTRSKAFPMGGTAYLSLEDSEEPYLGGIKYHAMPPLKRFRDMELLSGGEKTVAALALLFAIHSFQPAPFFVLDEVDAALDNANVAKVAHYIRTHASDTFQFIVISLKATFYERAQGLVGIYRDGGAGGGSKVLTLDLEAYDG